ncbi:toxic anion resistance protein [Actinokineospora sp. HUAS TT18]|uniref:toxic anion resistance protein n=1 Tax=Actinokineospora sp. HUAS TT18 TaxID=3447451 RepID=UPI003F524030
MILTPPDPVEPVPVERAAGLIPLTDEARASAADRAERFTGDLVALDPRSPDFADKIDGVLAVGESDMRVAASIASTLLDRSMKTDSSTAVTTTMVELRRTVVELDPSGLPTTRRKLLGVIPFGNDAKRLLDRYRAANTPVNQLVLQLRTRQDQLRRDNAAIKGERARLWENMTKLSEAALLAEAVDTAVDRQAGVLDFADPERAKALRADALHPIRQRHQDILTQLAVCAQGYLALDLVRRNNDELIRGVERAATTTVAALKVALVISAALADQREVIDEVNAIRDVTDGLIRANGQLISLQGDEIRELSADPAVGVAAIRESFDQIYQAIDAIDDYRASATTAMATTVSALSEELRRAESRLSRSHEGDL